jgi:hypothetical protein
MIGLPTLDRVAGKGAVDSIIVTYGELVGARGAEGVGRTWFWLILSHHTQG